MHKKSSPHIISFGVALLCIAILHWGMAHGVSYAACGRQVPGSRENCSSVCYNACKTPDPATGVVKPDCTGAPATWNNCCYQPGMDNNDRYDPVGQRCSCDDVLDDDASNDPYVANPPVCTSVPGATGLLTVPPYIYCGEGFSNLCCATQAECQTNLIGTPTPTGTTSSQSRSLFDYWREIGRMPGPILQNIIPADESSGAGGGGAVPQEPGPTIPIGNITPGLTITLGPTIASPGNPAHAQDIVNEARALYGASFNCAAAPSMQCISINSGNVNGITSQMTRVSTTFKQNINWSATTYNTLQCVGAAFALSRELNGVVPAIGHTAACEFVDTTNVHQYYPYGTPNFSPQAGDLVVWNSSNGNCNPATGHYGHIAYVLGVLGETHIQIAEGNWANPGDFRVRTVDINLTGKTPKGFLRKL